MPELHYQGMTNVIKSTQFELSKLARVGGGGGRIGFSKLTTDSQISGASTSRCPIGDVVTVPDSQIWLAVSQSPFQCLSGRKKNSLSFLKDLHPTVWHLNKLMPLSTFKSGLEASKVRKCQSDLCLHTKQAQLKKKKTSSSQFLAGFRNVLLTQI